MIKVTKETGTELYFETRMQAKKELANIIYAMRLQGITDEELVEAIVAGLVYDGKQEKGKEN